MLEVVKIDSLKLRIPLYKVKFVDSTFAEKYQKIFLETGELDEHINLDKHKVDIKNGITTRIAIVYSLRGSFRQEQIEIQCNAKQLESRYFEGINQETIKTIYEYIINLKIIYVSFKDFLDAYVSDIDFCYDVRVSPLAMAEANTEIYRNVKLSYYKFVSKPFRQLKKNVGIQFNSREKATPARPYIKIYHKTLELETKSNIFAEAYLQNQDWNDIGRLEYTLKNAKHKKHLDLHFQTLEDLLHVDTNILENFIFSGILQYIVKKTILKEYSDLSPTDRLLLLYINRLVEKGADKQSIYSALHIFKNPQERSRMKKKLKQLVENVDDKERMVANQETMNFLRKLRLNF